MKAPRVVISCAGVAVAAFAAGWMLKPAEVSQAPAGVVNRAVERAGAVRSAGAAARSVREQGFTVAQGDEGWAETAARELAEVRAAMKAGEVNGVLIEKLNGVLNIGEATIRLPRWQALLSAMRTEDVDAVRDIFRQNDKMGRYWEDEFQVFWKQWGFVDGASAVKRLVEVEKYPDKTASLMSGWGRKDANEALAWVRAHPGSLNTQEALRSIVYGAGNKKAEDADALLQANASDPQLQFLWDRVGHMIVYQKGMSGAKPWFEQLAAGSAPDEYKKANLKTIVKLMSGVDNAQAAAFSAQFAKEAWLPADAGKIMAREWAGDPAGNLAAVEGIVSTEARHAAATDLVRGWATKDAEGLSIWLTKNRGHSLFTQAARALVKEIASTNPEEAKAWSKKAGAVEAENR